MLFNVGSEHKILTHRFHEFRYGIWILWDKHDLLSCEADRTFILFLDLIVRLFSQFT